MDINEAYDGEVSDYLMRARGYIAKANSLEKTDSHDLFYFTDREEQQALAVAGIANALLAAIIMLVKETPP